MEHQRAHAAELAQQQKRPHVRQAQQRYRAVQNF